MNQEQKIAFANERAERLADERREATFLGVPVSKLSQKALCGVIADMHQRVEDDRNRRMEEQRFMDSLRNARGTRL